MPVIQNVQVPRTIYIHKETTNKSFLDVHYFLKAKGIQNNDFFLSLIDTDLRGVDPRDPNLPNYMKVKILQECKNNYWYFIREILRIQEQGASTSGGVKYKLNRLNLAMNFLFILNYNMFVEAPRQIAGKTTSSLARYLWVYNFGTTNSEIMFMHKDHSGSKNNLKKLKDMRELLPSYLRFDSNVNADGKKLKVPNTIVMIQHPYNNNRIITLPSARTKDSAENLGRGSTQPIQYYDEFAFMQYNNIVYAAASPAFSKASENAKKHGAPYGILITTTPGDLLTDQGNYAYDMRNKATPWLEQYYDLTFDRLEGLRLANKLNPFFLVSFTYKQLGGGNEYFMDQVRQMGGDWPKIRREILLEWSSTANNCPFAQEDLDKIKQHLKEPIRTLLFGQFSQYQFHIYEDIDLTYPPIIGVDVSGATFNDASAITIIDSHTTRVCATLNCNFIPADDLADVIYQITTKYMPTAVINCERNGGFGISVIQRLCKTSIKRNLYWEVKDRVIEERFDGIHMNKRPQKVKVYGLNSTKEVRARLIEILMERVMYHKDKFVAPILHQEMQAMEVKKNGKVEHSDNSHDDQVFSYLMALYVWYDGKNLADNFHIMKNTLKTDADEDLEEAELEDQLEVKVKLDPIKLISDDIEKIKDINDTLEWVETDAKSFMTTDKFAEQQMMEMMVAKQALINSNPSMREKIFEETGVDPVSYINGGNDYVNLPDNLFGEADQEIDFDYDMGAQFNPNASHVKGNLANMFQKL